MKSRYNRIMVATFGYDNGSRRTSRVLGDAPGTQTAWVYGRQDDLPTAINSGIPGASFSYTYDANKNKLTEGISAPMANVGFNSTAYDPADRLTAWNRTDGNLDQAWNLSLVGNWATFTENQVQQTRTHTAVHEIAAIDANPIAHDATGNLTRNPGDTLDRYTWDFDNRLASADVDQDGTPDCLYRHDALGRRVSKTVPDGEASVTTVFVGTIQALEYSPHAVQVLAEYPADALAASPVRKFVYAEYIDEPVMMLSTNGATTTPYYYHQNSLYSVAALTDVSGTVVERYAYSAYGKPMFLDANANLLDPQESTVGNPYLFTGRRLDPETGLYYYRARMYDAVLGRFVSRDPIGYAGGSLGLYAYVRNDPLRMLDPLGMIPQSELDCQTACYAGCERQYPRWYQYHLYVGCVSGCNLGCAGKDVTFCNYVNSWPESYADALQCVCGGIGIADMIPLPPVLSQLSGGLDCACGIVTQLQMQCKHGNNWDSESFFKTFVLDCGTDVLTTLSGASLGGMMNGMIALFEGGLMSVQNEILKGAPGGKCVSKACTDWAASW
ncbi:MAG: RHS repeat-associated core domain-containing protein [Patescibacteria group bacterium]|nr:RHS repeat-associated core domain-containing protein [Patescibacteria group bacterium]